MMRFDVDRPDASTAVVTLTGEVMGGPDGNALHDKLRALKADGVRRVVLNMEGVRLMNSSGLGMLISALTTVRNAQGDLRLAGVQGRVSSLLMITKLDGVFPQHETVEDALASF